jgi:hypothetical protein
MEVRFILNCEIYLSNLRVKQYVHICGLPSSLFYNDILKETSQDSGVCFVVSSLIRMTILLKSFKYVICTYFFSRIDKDEINFIKNTCVFHILLKK